MNHDVLLTGAAAEGAFGLGIFLYIYLAVALVLNIAASIGLYNIAVDQEYDKAWLAWIPVVNIFMLPLLVEDYVPYFLSEKLTALFILSFALGILAGGWFPFVWLLLVVLMVYSFFFIADQYSMRPWLYVLAAAGTLGLAIPYLLFRFKDRESLYE